MRLVAAVFGCLFSRDYVVVRLLADLLGFSCLWLLVVWALLCYGGLLLCCFGCFVVLLWWWSCFGFVCLEFLFGACLLVGIWLLHVAVYACGCGCFALIVVFGVVVC